MRRRGSYPRILRDASSAAHGPRLDGLSTAADHGPRFAAGVLTFSLRPCIRRKVKVGSALTFWGVTCHASGTDWRPESKRWGAPRGRLAFVWTPQHACVRTRHGIRSVEERPTSHRAREDMRWSEGGCISSRRGGRQDQRHSSGLDSDAASVSQRHPKDAHSDAQGRRNGHPFAEDDPCARHRDKRGQASGRVPFKALRALNVLPASMLAISLTPAGPKCPV